MNKLISYLFMISLAVVLLVGCVGPIFEHDYNDYLCVRYADSTSFEKIKEIDFNNDDISELLKVENFVVTPDEQNFIVNSGINGIWRVGINSDEEMLLTNDLWVKNDQISLSYDGSKVVFSARGDIYSVNVDGSALTQLTNTPDDYEEYPGFTEAEDKILFTCINNLNEPQQNHTICKMNNDGSGRENLVMDNSRAAIRFSYPTVLGESGKIVYLVHGDESGLDCLDTADGSLNRFYSEELHDRRISVSTDGEIFSISGNHGYAVLNAQGTILLDKFGSYDYRGAVIAPDGNRIIYTKNHALRIRDISSGIENESFSGEQPYWMGEKIFFVLEGTYYL